MRVPPPNVLLARFPLCLTLGANVGGTDLMLYRCIVKQGHSGSGRHTERAVMVRAKSSLEAMQKAKRLPGVKKGRMMRNAGSVLSVEPWIDAPAA